jgi:hypothetical protein
MKNTHRFCAFRTLSGALLLSILATGAAQAHEGEVACGANIGVLGTSPFTCTVELDATSGLFLDTINFSVADPNFLVTITSTTSNISFFSLPIFENQDDALFASDIAGQHTDVDLSAYASLADPDYHVHPQGLILGAGASYELTFSAAAPVPEASTYGMMLAGLGLVGFAARRRRS